MKVKVSEASGTVLNWMVAKAEGADFHYVDGRFCVLWTEKCDVPLSNYRPSTDWAQGGPIIEWEGLGVTYDRYWGYDPDDETDNGDRWFAEYIGRGDQCISSYGPTPLIAAMRCFCCIKLGEEVEVCDELTS